MTIIVCKYCTKQLTRNEIDNKECDNCNNPLIEDIDDEDYDFFENEDQYDEEGNPCELNIEDSVLWNLSDWEGK